jgi:hypothetical protein
LPETPTQSNYIQFKENKKKQQHNFFNTKGVWGLGMGALCNCICHPINPANIVQLGNLAYLKT